MGKCKDELTPKKDTTKSLFDRFKTKKVTKQTKAQNLADHLQAVDAKLDDLLKTKEAEFKAEKGSESENRKKLGFLRTMRFHVDQTINTAAEYGDAS